LSCPEIVVQFRRLELKSYAEPLEFDRRLEQGLWVLWVAKQELDRHCLTAAEIAEVLTRVVGIGVGARSIEQAFKRAGSRVHAYGKAAACYGIMASGIEHIRRITRDEAQCVNVLAVAAGEYSTSKRETTSFLAAMRCPIRACDPYCSPRTLDMLPTEEWQHGPVRFLTRTAHLSPNNKGRLIRSVRDFSREFPAFEFRDYPDPHLHDRFLLSANRFLWLGHSMKDLGSKDSFVVMLGADVATDLYQSMGSFFDARWKRGRAIT